MSVLLTVLGLAGLILAIVLFNAWWVMLLSGALGHIFNQPALFLSYGASIIVSLVIGFIANMYRN